MEGLYKNVLKFKKNCIETSPPCSIEEIRTGSINISDIKADSAFFVDINSILMVFHSTGGMLIPLWPNSNLGQVILSAHVPPVNKQ